jgi:hypothetical protein
MPQMPPSVPIVNVKLRFAELDEIAKSSGYVKQIPSVFEENINFNFTDEDYEFSLKDREWLRAQTTVDMSGVTEKQFERIIDCLDKIQQLYRDTQVEKVKEWFDIHADEALRKDIKKS